MRPPTSFTAFAFLFTSTLTSAQAIGPVFTASFTWNAKCDATVACGPDTAGSFGTGYAASNNVTFAANQPIVDGKGAGCGQCWHLTPQYDAYQSNGKKLGTSVVVKINDQCTDPKYCDQLEFGNPLNLNTGYKKQTHFDLCHASGVTNQFFGEIAIGVATGLAQQVDCSELSNGKFGSGMGDIGSSAAPIEKKKSAEHAVGAANNIMVAMPGDSISSPSPVIGQPSTIADVVKSNAAPDRASLASSDSADGEDDDECDEL